jgi:hypothetical protein
MPPKGSSRIFLATATTLLTVHGCILLGGTMREAAIAFCAFALLIGAPIALLLWLGSLPDLESRRQARHRGRKAQLAETQLWQRTLLEAQAAAAPLPGYNGAVLAGSDLQPTAALRPLSSRIASAPALPKHEAERANRPILALCLAVVSATGLGACETIDVFDEPRRPDGWMMVQPGMGTAELVGLVGGPDYVRSNGTTEVWQYCRDRSFPIKWRDEGRNAKYYTAVLVDNDVIREVRPYPVVSRAGCKDFYRAEF